MSKVKERVEKLINLAADGDGPENKSAAHKAILMLKEHGMEVLGETQKEEHPLNMSPADFMDKYGDLTTELVKLSKQKGYSEGYKQALKDMKSDMSKRYKNQTKLDQFRDIFNGE